MGRPPVNRSFNQSLHQRCPFAAVRRRRDDGMYYCSMCHRELGPNFAKQIAAALALSLQRQWEKWVERDNNV